MTNSIRHDFHSDLATLIYSEIQYQHSNYYYFLGKVESWGIGDKSPMLMQPDSDLENTLIRTNALYMKRITPNDISIVTQRHNWESGVVYDIWDHTKNMKVLAFYCVTDANTVYKCLDNNGGIPSTVKPSGKSFYTFKTGDGYTWKYMYTIPTFKRSRFMSFNYIPVQRALTDTFYNKGSVDDVIVVNSGSGYSDSPLTYIRISGTTTGDGASGFVTIGSTGNITGVTITSGGANYVADVDVAFTTTSGHGAVGVATIVGGVVTDVVITSSGVGYTADDSVMFSVGGAVLVPVVSRVSGSITSIKIISSGAGYTVAPTASVVTVTGDGTGKYNNPTALLSSVIYNGRVVEVNIVDPGISYPSDNATSIVVQGDGTGASFSPVIYAGGVVDVVVENTGTGYTSMSLTVVGLGSGAILNPMISTSDFISDQSIVEQTAVVGSINSIQITNVGANYSANTTVEIVGDGDGCSAVPVIVGGELKSIRVISAGSEYTYADVVISDTTRNIIGGNIDAQAYVVLPPVGGHGYDAVSELFGDTLAINSSLRQDNALNNLFQDYRQFGLIKNPTNIVNGKKYIEQTALMAYSVVFDTVVGLVKDEILKKNNVKFRVVAITDNIVTLQQLGVKYVDPVGILVAAAETTRVYTAINITSYPIANKYSGKLIYSSNENPFSFTEDQGIIIKTFLKF